MNKRTRYIQSAIYNAMNYGLDTIRLLKEIDVNHHDCDSNITKLTELARNPENFRELYYKGYLENKKHFFVTALQLDIEPDIVFDVMTCTVANDPIIHPYLVSYLVKNLALPHFSDMLKNSSYSMDMLHVPVLLELLQQYPVDLLYPYLDVMYRQELFEGFFYHHPEIGKNIYTGDSVRDLITSLVFGDAVDRFLLGYYHNVPLWLYAAKGNVDGYYQTSLENYPLLPLFSFKTHLDKITSYRTLTEDASMKVEESTLYVT